MYVRVAVLPLSLPQRVSCAPARGAFAHPRRALPPALPVRIKVILALTTRLSPPRPSLSCRSIHIVALGNEGDAFHQDNRPSGLIRTYLGRSPLVSGDESSLLLNATSTVARPVFTEYQASAFGNVKLVVHDCPVWVRGGSCSAPRLTEIFFKFFFPLPLPFPPFILWTVWVTCVEFLNVWGEIFIFLCFIGQGAAGSENTLRRQKAPVATWSTYS